MSTNLQIITNALRELNVIAETETASAEQGSYCLPVLNRMMEQWTEDSIDIGYFKQSTIGDTIPIPEWSEAGVIGQLAMKIASHYGASVSPELALMAKEGYNTILRKSLVDRTLSVDLSHMPQGEGKYRRGRNILNDA